MKLISQYKTNKSRICMMGCIVDILNYYDFFVDESIIFALSSGYYFFYKKPALSNNIEDNFESFQVIMSSMQYDLSEIFSNVSEALNLETEISSDVTDYEIKKFIKNNIDKKQPVISIVSREHLDYMEKRSRDKVPHLINITGYDFLENNLYISDTYIPSVPVKTYSGPLSWDSYKRALLFSKDMFNRDFTFRSIVYLLPKTKSFAELSLQKKIQPLKKMAINYYQKKYIDKDIMFGQFAFKHFIYDLEGWFSLGKVPSLLKVFRELSIRINNFGGQFITNQLMAEYMECLYNTYQTQIFQKMRDEFASISSEWFIIANLLLKASFGKIDDVKKSICDRIKVIFETEDKIYQAFLDM